MSLSFKERAAFSQENKEKIDAIIAAGNDLEKLARIPPSFIVMDLTWRCNYNCICCVEEETVNKTHNDLPIEIIEDIFEYSQKHGVRGIMTMGGEDFLHKQGMKKALEKSIEYNLPLKTVTNGSCVRPLIDLISKAYSIPGSMLRFSINADKNNYKEQTRQKVGLKVVLDNIQRITSTGVKVSVSTVFFPFSSREDGAIPNIFSLESIIEDCEKSGVSLYILMPARNPITKKRYHSTAFEKKKIEEIKNKKYNGIEMAGILSEDLFYEQNLDFNPCPSGFLFTLICSDGKIYKCTDNRGRDSMVLGRIEKPGDFEEFWHSEERVKKQFETSCPNIGCIRYKINSLLDSGRKLYKQYGINNSEYLIQKPEAEKHIFI